MPNVWEPLERRHKQLKDNRADVEKHWRLVQEYLAPRTGRWLASDRGKGGHRNGRYLHSAPRLAHRVMTAGMSRTANPYEKWFRLTHKLAEMREVKNWLFETEETLYDIYAAANFYGSMTQVFSEMGAYGIGAMLLEEDFQDVISCHSFTIGQYSVAHNSKGRLAAFSLEYEATYGEMVDAFGMEGSERVSDMIVRDVKQSPDAKTEVHMLLEENDDRIVHPINGDPRTGRERMPYRAVFWDKNDSSRFLRIQGFESLPLIAPRWEVISNDDYPISPGFDAVPDIASLYETQENLAFQVETVGKPPKVGSAGLKSHGSSIRPGADNWADASAAGPALQAVYQIDPRVNELRLLMGDTIDGIRSTFYNDVFFMLANLPQSGRTAFEVSERKEEKLTVLTNVFERTRVEGLDIVHARTMDRAMAQGRLPEMPEALLEAATAGGLLDIEYLSPLAQAQRAIGTEGIDRLLLAAQNIAAGKGDPNVYMKIDEHQLMDEYAKMLGVPPRIIRDDAEVQEMVQQAIQAAQQQQAIEQGAQMAAGAKDLGDTNTGDDTGLGRVLSNLGVAA